MFAEFWTKATGPLFESAELKNIRHCASPLRFLERMPSHISHILGYFPINSSSISLVIADPIPPPLSFSVINDTISKTYKVISVSQYSELMNLKDGELQAHLKELEASGWKHVDSTLHIPSDANAVKPKQTAEVLQFEQFGKILAPLR